MMSGKARVLSFRSSNFKADAGVVPSDEACEDAGIEVVKTDFQHDHFSDRGPDDVKDKVRSVLARFLEEDKPPKKPSLWRRQKDQSNDRVSVNYAK